MPANGKRRKTDMENAQRNIASLIFLMHEANREVSLDVKGNSMLPFLAQGDRVTVCPVRPEELSMGDVLLFRQNGQLIVHRLVGKKRIGAAYLYCQKGDNLSGWSWISGEDIIGRVTSFGHSDAKADMAASPWRWINFLMGAQARGWVVLETGFSKMMNAFPGRSFPVPFKRAFRKYLSLFSVRVPGGILKILRKHYMTGR